MGDLVLVATLQVRRDALDAFRRFEAIAARVMSRHGGAIERVVVLRPEAPDADHREVHLVRFPDEAAFAAYRGDPELLAASPLREQSVIATSILVGTDGPDYHRAAV